MCVHFAILIFKLKVLQFAFNKNRQKVLTSTLSSSTFFSAAPPQGCNKKNSTTMNCFAYVQSALKNKQML